MASFCVIWVDETGTDNQNFPTLQLFDGTSVVLMDNSSFHCIDRVTKAIY